MNLKEAEETAKHLARLTPQPKLIAAREHKERKDRPLFPFVFLVLEYIRILARCEDLPEQGSICKNNCGKANRTEIGSGMNGKGMEPVPQPSFRCRPFLCLHRWKCWIAALPRGVLSRQTFAQENKTFEHSSAKNANRDEPSEKAFFTRQVKKSLRLPSLSSSLFSRGSRGFAVQLNCRFKIHVFHSICFHGFGADDLRRADAVERGDGRRGGVHILDEAADGRGGCGGLLIVEFAVDAP